MSDIVTLTNERCQAGCREDAMGIRITQALAPIMQQRRKDRREGVQKHSQGATGFGI
jgi:hypothetical protein